MDWSIVPIDRDCVELVADVFDFYRQFYGQPPDPHRSRKFIDQRFSGKESVIFVAKSTTKVIGFVQLYPSFSSVSMKRLWILNDLFVLPEARRRGVGVALMNHAREFAIQTGAKGLVLETMPDNIVGQRLYESLGYRKDESIHYHLDTPSQQISLMVTRTYLEMKQPPKFDRPEFAVDVRIERVLKPTVSYYRYLYDAVGSPWRWIDRKQMNDTDLEAIIHDERIKIFVLYKSGVPAGYLELNGKMPKEIEIAYFGLMPQFIGAGLGKSFLRWGVVEAWAADVARVWLHTCTLDHTSALPLYMNTGFVPFRSEQYQFNPDGIL